MLQTHRNRRVPTVDSRVRASSANSQPVPLRQVLLFGMICALAVGNIYFAQPLLYAMAQTFAVPKIGRAHV